MMYLKCKPEKVGETVKAAAGLFARGNVLIEKIVMSKLSWVAIFGEERKPSPVSGVDVELSDIAGNEALILLGTNRTKKAGSATKKAKK